MVEIQYNTQLLDEEHKNIMTEFLQTKLTELSQQLNLSTLEKIIITNNFTHDVIKIQKEYGMRILGHTDNDSGVAVAKVIHTIIEEELRQAIIINDYIIASLFNPESAQLGFHYLHHELCHVHDHYFTHKIFTIEGRRGIGMNKLEHTLIYNADPIWSEYIAVRLSATSMPIPEMAHDLPCGDLNITYLIQLISTCKEKLDAAIGSYRYDGDINKLFIYTQEETSLLFKIAATTQGYIDGLNLSGHEITAIIENYLSNTYFIRAWKIQWGALRNLFNIFPNWNDVYQLKDLGEAVSICWEDMGIIASYNEELKSIYIDVPYEIK